MPLGELVWYVLSFVLLLVACVHIVRSTRRSQRGLPTAYDVLLFTALVFLAALAFEIGQSDTPSLFGPLYHVIQIVGGNRELEGVRLPDGRLLHDALRVYSAILYVLTPTATILAIVSYLVELLTVPLVRLLSLRRDVFVFSQLDERSLGIAQSVQSYYAGKSRSVEVDATRRRRRACIVYACVDREEEQELAAQAYEMGATCTSLDAEDILRSCAHSRLVTIILSSKDEGRNRADAKALMDRIRQEGRRECAYRIVALTSLRNVETVLLPEPTASTNDGGAEGVGEFENVVLRSFDPARILVERVIDRYPLFLLSNPDSGWRRLAAERLGGDAVGERALCDLYGREDRHVVVLGAGAIGMEFASSALWASRIDGVHTRIDVLDRVEDPMHPGEPAARARFWAQDPEIMHHVGAGDVARDAAGDAYTDEYYDLSFQLVDVETGAYLDYLRAQAATISYVLVALGSDRANISCAMYTRRVLERELVRRSSDRESYLMASRPLIIAVVENDELADIVQDTADEGQPYDIVCVGRLDHSPTYEHLLAMVGERVHEYDRRSRRANHTHRKYRLFAYLRNLRLGRHGMVAADGEAFGRLASGIDWTEDPSSWEAGCGREAVETYNAYRRTEREAAKAGGEGAPVEIQTHALDVEAERAGDGRPSREWLLRMEHERWNAYIRAEGFEVASIEETRVLFDTGQKSGGSKLHRSNLAGLHPCLVSFDELSELDAPVGELYDEAGIPGTLRTTFQLQDDEYIGI